MLRVKIVSFIFLWTCHRSCKCLHCSPVCPAERGGGGGGGLPRPGLSRAGHLAHTLPGAMRPPVLYIDPVTEESGEHASWEGLRPALLLPGILLYPGTASQDHSQV